MKSLFEVTTKQAIAIFDSKMWEKWSAEEKVKFQLYQNKLCMPFGVFHEAIEKVLDRSVWTHEFAFPDKLKNELEGKSRKPTMEEVINLIPEDKRIVIIGDLD